MSVFGAPQLVWFNTLVAPIRSGDRNLRTNADARAGDGPESPAVSAAPLPELASIHITSPVTTRMRSACRGSDPSYRTGRKWSAAAECMRADGAAGGAASRDPEILFHFTHRLSAFDQSPPESSGTPYATWGRGLATRCSVLPLWRGSRLAAHSNHFPAIPTRRK